MADGFQWAGYQQRWLADQAPQKIVVKSRRIGFSEVAIFDCVQRALGINLITGERHKPVPQNILSASHAQAKALLARAVRYLDLFGSQVPGGVMVGKPGAEVIHLRGGVDMVALPTNPRTARGGEGDVLLDEYGSMPHADEIWKAVAPLAKPTLGRREGYKIRIVGTPLGDDNLFYRMAEGDLKDSFSRHKVDVYEAVRDGFPLTVQRGNEWVPGTIADLMREIADPDAFAQEYGCSFLSASTRYISEALYNESQYSLSDIARLPVGDPTIFPRLFGGYDVARERDASAMALLQEHGDLLWQKGEVEAERGVPWDDQEAWLDRTANKATKICIDKTGMGDQFSERAENRWPGKVEGVAFTTSSKEELATGLKLAMTRHKLRLIEEDVDLRRDVLSLRKDVTKAGNVRFSAPRTKSGHADRAWALALAVYAAGGVAIHHGVGKVHVPSEALPKAQQAPHVADGYARPRRGAWR